MKTLTELSKEYDSNNVLSSIELFKKQCEEGYTRGSQLHIPDEYKKIDTIVFGGMGGSALPAHILRSWNILKKPSAVWNRYGSLSYIDSNTLFVGLSYSGGTEETLASTESALLSGAKCLGVTLGGELADILLRAQSPVCTIDETNNPCRQPRFAVGFILGALIGIFETLDFLNQKIPMQEIFTAFEKNFFSPLDDESMEAKLARALVEKIPVIVGSEHLAQVAHFFQNQLNETGKTFATYHEIPEVNHHLLEALRNPATNKKNLVFVFVESRFYNKRNAIRFTIMRELVEKAGIQTLSFGRTSATWSEEVFLLMESIEFVSLYVGLYHHCDPSDIPFVALLKEKLAQK
ncbi:MAG: hypothetical protein KBB88_03315 [Candidatus Pacebacteria bacterium]|nr:hypothetical protein [Candidatus Paceibacterota bacterium]